MTSAAPWGLFERFGVELEYMVVDARTLDVAPRADELLRAASGGEAWTGDVDRGEIAWSNELAAHVIELKTAEPAPSLAGLAARFQTNVREMLALLAPLGCRLMPAAMHPWMDPLRETRLWPHESSEVYAAYDRIFGCRGHGWSNLQSVHLNLPFANDDEFGRLHAAIRLLMPILPALAASSPVIERRLTGMLDTRLDTYRGNQARIPSVAGEIVPEPVFTRADYEHEIFARMYADVAPYDPHGVLQHEFLNSRGAIARFSRGSIEIRVLDVQECPTADVAVVAAITAVLQALVHERSCSFEDQQRWPTAPLAKVLQATIEYGEQASIDREYAAALGVANIGAATAGELWASLLASAAPAAARADAPDPWSEWRPAWRVLCEQGPLARRLLRALGSSPGQRRLFEVYENLCARLEQGELFVGE